jgi:hypothetical protein
MQPYSPESELKLAALGKSSNGLCSVQLARVGVTVDNTWRPGLDVGIVTLRLKSYRDKKVTSCMCEALPKGQEQSNGCYEIKRNQERTGEFLHFMFRPAKIRCED